MRDWRPIGALARCARPIDMDPLTVAAALCELVYARLVHRNPGRYAQFLPNVLSDPGKSQLRHRKSSGSASGLWPPGSFGQELLNDRRRFDRARHQKQMTVIKNFEAGVRHEARHHMCVDDWDDGVVGPGQNERWLLQRPKPRQAGPTCHRHDLIEVSAAARSTHRFGMGFDELRVLAEGAAVNLLSDTAHEALVDVSPRRRHLPQHPRTAGHHDRPRRRRRQHELSAHIVVLMGELLRNPAAPRYAADVGALMSKFRQKLRGQPRN